MRRVAPPLVSVVAVAVVILLLLVLNSRPSHPGPAPGAVALPPSAPTVTPDTSTAASATSATPSAGPTAATAVAPPVNEPPATQPPATPHPPVTVLNNSRRTGLAHHVAAEVRAKGWPVGEIGNFTGRIAMTTVYYASGQRAAAEALARALPQIRRVEPRFTGLPGSGLTLVVTRDWTG